MLALLTVVLVALLAIAGTLDTGAAEWESTYASTCEQARAERAR